MVEIIIKIFSQVLPRTKITIDHFKLIVYTDENFHSTLSDFVGVSIQLSKLVLDAQLFYLSNGLTGPSHQPKNSIGK